MRTYFATWLQTQWLRVIARDFSAKSGLPLGTPDATS